MFLKDVQSYVMCDHAWIGGGQCLVSVVQSLEAWTTKEGSAAANPPSIEDEQESLKGASTEGSEIELAKDETKITTQADDFEKAKARKISVEAAVVEVSIQSILKTLALSLRFLNLLVIQHARSLHNLGILFWHIALGHWMLDVSLLSVHWSLRDVSWFLNGESRERFALFFENHGHYDIGRTVSLPQTMNNYWRCDQFGEGTEIASWGTWALDLVQPEAEWWDQVSAGGEPCTSRCESYCSVPPWYSGLGQSIAQCLFSHRRRQQAWWQRTPLPLWLFCSDACCIIFPKSWGLPRI